MSDPREAYTNALLALSGNPHLTQARKALLAGISDSELKTTIARCVRELRSRQDLEEALCILLDYVAVANKSRQGSASGVGAGGQVVTREPGQEAATDHEQNAASPQHTSLSSATVRRLSHPSEALVAQPVEHEASPSPPVHWPRPVTDVDMECGAAESGHEGPDNMDSDDDGASQRPVADAINPEELDKFGSKLCLRVVATRIGFGPPFWYVDLNKYPLLRQVLTDRLKQDVWSDPWNAWYCTNPLQKDPWMDIDQARCLNIFLDPATRGSRCIFTPSNNKEFACKACIDQKKLCIRPVQVSRLDKLAVHPLPKHLRGDSMAWNLAYWVQE